MLTLRVHVLKQMVFTVDHNYDCEYSNPECSAFGYVGHRRESQQETSLRFVEVVELIMTLKTSYMVQIP